MDKSPDAFRSIREVSEWLDTPAHVLRFWESRFSQVRPVQRAGGRRYYRPADMLLLGGIKRLLHEDGHTIRRVQKMLGAEGTRAVAALSRPLPEAAISDPLPPGDPAPGRRARDLPSTEDAGNFPDRDRQAAPAASERMEEMPEAALMIPQIVSLDDPGDDDEGGMTEPVSALLFRTGFDALARRRARIVPIYSRLTALLGSHGREGG